MNSRSYCVVVESSSLAKKIASCSRNLFTLTDISIQILLDSQWVRLLPNFDLLSLLSLILTHISFVSLDEIARRAGFKNKLPKGTVVIATEESVIGPENPMSAEKLSPVLTIFRAPDFEKGLDMCQALAENGGIGHTAGFYTSESGTLSPRAAKFISQVPVGRVIVNAPTSLTAIGSSFNFNVDPSLR